MEQIDKALQDKLTQLQNIQTLTGNSTTKAKYTCTVCKDDGWVLVGDNTYAKCECSAQREIEDIKKRCGISDAFMKKTIDSYTAISDEQKKLKKMATNYLKEVTKENIKSIGYFGQSGVGKTHLTCGIAIELMARNIPVYYMAYTEKMTELKSLNRGFDTVEDYQKLMNRLKNIKVLMIDDLFKGAGGTDNKVNPVDVRIMFEIINYRVLNNLAIIVSSEFTTGQIVERVDQALGGRIIEMCNSYISNTGKDIKNNYRMRNAI